MKKFLIATFVAASLSAGVASADSTHECQGGHNCNDGGSVGPITISTPVTIGPVTATATGIGMGGAGGAGGQGGSGGTATSSSSATGGTASATGGSATSSSSSGGNTLSTGASSSTSSSGGNNLSGSMRGGDVNVSTNVRPAASAPSGSLTSVGTDNCLGSVNGSFGNGFISIGGGKTTESVECNRRANSRRLEQLGMYGAAVALQCMNDEVREAMKIAGTPCPQDEAKDKKVSSAPLSREEKMAAARVLKESGQPNLGIEIVREEAALVSHY